MQAVVTRSKSFGPYTQLLLEAPALARRARPGQFVEVLTQAEGRFWRRPFSICRATNRGIDLLVKAVGPGSAWLAKRQPGDRLDVIGPLGQGFRLPGRGPVLLVGGGFGIAPLLFVAERLRQAGRPAEVLMGGRCADDLLLRKELRLTGATVACATEDGSSGVRGRVTRLLENRLRQNSAGLTIAAAGPKPMLAAVASMAAAHQVWAEVSLEEVMACGLGVCNGCAVKISGVWKRVCQDGPVFPAQAVEWS